MLITSVAVTEFKNSLLLSPFINRQTSPPLLKKKNWSHSHSSDVIQWSTEHLLLKAALCQHEHMANTHEFRQHVHVHGDSFWFSGVWIWQVSHIV